MIKDLQKPKSFLEFFRPYMTPNDKVLRDDKVGVGYSDFILAPDGKTVVSLDNNSICFLDCETLEARVEDVGQPISHMTMTADGCIFLASGSKLISKDYAKKKLAVKNEIMAQTDLPAGVADIVTQYGFFSRTSEEIEQERIKMGLTISG